MCRSLARGRSHSRRRASGRSSSLRTEAELPCSTSLPPLGCACSAAGQCKLLLERRSVDKSSSLRVNEVWIKCPVARMLRPVSDLRLLQMPAHQECTAACCVSSCSGARLMPPGSGTSQAHPGRACQRVFEFSWCAGAPRQAAVPGEYTLPELLHSKARPGKRLRGITMKGAGSFHMSFKWEVSQRVQLLGRHTN